MCGCKCEKAITVSEDGFRKLATALNGSSIDHVSRVNGDEYILFRDGTRIVIEGRTLRCS